MRTNTITLLGIAIGVVGCSSTGVDPDSLVGEYELSEWLVTNTADRSEQFDSNRFYTTWNLLLTADSTFTVSYKTEIGAGISFEAGLFSSDPTVVSFETNGPKGQLSLGGRDFSYTLTADGLKLSGTAPISWELGQLVEWAPAPTRFLGYIADSEITLVRK